MNKCYKLEIEIHTDGDIGFDCEELYLSPAQVYLYKKVWDNLEDAKKEALDILNRMKSTIRGETDFDEKIKLIINDIELNNSGYETYNGNYYGTFIRFGKHFGDSTITKKIMELTEKNTLYEIEKELTSLPLFYKIKEKEEKHGMILNSKGLSKNEILDIILDRYDYELDSENIILKSILELDIPGIDNPFNVTFISEEQITDAFDKME